MSARLRRRAAACALLAFALGPSCAPSSSPEPGPPAVLRVGTSGDYAPFSLAGEGFDVEVARRLAAELGAELEWVEFRWPELAADVAANRFDVAMSGVTWRADRARIGELSRAVASGGPCLYGRLPATRVAVNRGGFLERWARATLERHEIRAVDRNTSLPERLLAGEVDALVTDSFELSHFRREAPGGRSRCWPPIHRKVYWVAPARAADLAPRIDAFVREHEPALRVLRERHFGEVSPRDDLDHVIDLMARRLALMPAVGRWKRAHDRPIEDLAREAGVLERTAAAAARAGLAAEPAQDLFAFQIELAKRIQERAAARGPDLELSQIRPGLLRLGDRLLEGLGRVVPVDAASLSEAKLAPLEAWLTPEERRALGERIAKLRRIPPNSTGMASPSAGPLPLTPVPGEARRSDAGRP